MPKASAVTSTQESMQYTPQRSRPPKRRKSDDSARQDAEVAIQKDRLETKPEPETLLDIHQGKLAEAKERGDSPDKLQVIMEGLANLTNSLLMVIKRTDALEAKGPAVGAVIATARNYAMCPTCGQVLKDSTSGRGICNGTHAFIFVAPKSQQFWKAFPGVRVNGRTYSGNCVVAEDMKENILSAVSRWEDQHQKLFHKGGTVFGAQEIRNVGSIGHTPIIQG